MLTPYQKHVADWKDCRRCNLCAGRTKVVLVRGQLPCDVLFVGEAPGGSEDLLGKPFAGPAGHLLDSIVEQAWDGTFKVAFTNLVACIPLGDDGAKTAEPAKEAIKACAPRLLELVAMAKPRLIVAVGKLAQEWLDPKRKPNVGLPDTVPQVAITHPAAILRANVSARGLMVQKCVVTLADAAETYLG